MARAGGYNLLASMAACCAVVVIAAQSHRLGKDAAPSRSASNSSDPNVLRVWADPNNLPFSNEKGEGFENKLASSQRNSARGWPTPSILRRPVSCA